MITNKQMDKSWSTWYMWHSSNWVTVKNFRSPGLITAYLLHLHGLMGLCRLLEGRPFICLPYLLVHRTCLLFFFFFFLGETELKLYGSDHIWPLSWKGGRREAPCLAFTLYDRNCVSLCDPYGSLWGSGLHSLFFPSGIPPLPSTAPISEDAHSALLQNSMWSKRNTPPYPWLVQEWASDPASKMWAGSLIRNFWGKSPFSQERTEKMWSYLFPLDTVSTMQLPCCDQRWGSYGAWEMEGPWCDCVMELLSWYFSMRRLLGLEQNNSLLWPSTVSKHSKVFNMDET